MAGLAEQVGRLFMIGFPGLEPDEAAWRLIRDRRVAGVILFARNIADGAQVTSLIERLRAEAPQRLLLAADQEGGSVLRVRAGASQLPSAMGLARLGPDGVREAARICGLEMRAMGFDLNFAPVLDVNQPENPGIGMRAYGDDVRAVSRLGRAYVEGLQGAGMLACGKHFPGAGAARADAHLALPRIERDLATLVAQDLPPFRAAVEADVASILVGHCVYPAWDGAEPASLSRRVTTGLLRDELGFAGLAITDDMEMDAIMAHQPWPEAAVSAFAAGADLLLVCHDAGRQAAALDAVTAALESGRVPMSRLEEAIARHDAFLARLSDAPRPALAPLVAAHGPILDGMCGAIVERIQDPHGALPLTGEAVDVYWPDMSVMTRVEEGGVGEAAVLTAFQARFHAVRLLRYDPVDAPIDGLADQRPVVFFSANAHLHPSQAALLQAARERATPFVLVALRDPYDATLAGPDAAVIASYGFLPNMLAATLRALFDDRKLVPANR